MTIEEITAERDAAISERDKIKSEYAAKFGGDDNPSPGDEKQDKEVFDYFKNNL